MFRLPQQMEQEHSSSASKPVDEQRRVRCLIAASNSGQNVPKRRALYRKQQRMLRRLKKQHNSGLRSLSSYWRAVAQTVHVFG